MKNHLLFVSIAALTSALSTQAHAQTPRQGDETSSADNPATGNSGFEDIVVTARRRAENLQSVPIAVTAVDQAALSKNGSFSPINIAQVAPGVTATGTTGDRSAVIYAIRGQAFSFGNSFPAVVPYFAEVPIVADFSTGSFFDLENLQVLRGPQGVRFGRVTDGGAVLVQPKKPTNSFEGYVKATVGDYDRQTLEGAINIPLVEDKVLLRVAGERARVGGYTLNLTSGRMLDDTHYNVIRAGLTLRPTSTLDNTLIVQYNRAKENGNSNVFNAFRASKFSGTRLQILTNALAAQQARGPRIVQNGSTQLGPDAGIFNDRMQLIVSNITTANLTSDITLRNILGYVHTKNFKGFDYDGSPESLVDSYGRIVPRSDLEHLSEELQVNGRTGIVAWTIGGYMDRQKPVGPYESVTFLGPTVGSASTFVNFSRQTTTSRAAYAQAEVDLASFVPGLKMNGGIRYTKDRNHTFASSNRLTSYTNFISLAYVHGLCNPAQPCTEFKSKWNVVTYEGGVSYQANRDIFTYVSYRKGYRPGGVNTIISTFASSQFDPETDNSLELGVKVNTKLGTIPLRMNIAGFYDKYNNIQKRINFLDPGGSGQGVTAMTNTAKATIEGIEFEGEIQPLPGLDLGYNFAYTDAKFSKKGYDLATLVNPTNGACNSNAPTNIGFCPLNRFAVTPKFQMTGSAGYTLPLDASIGKIRFGVDVFHQSSVAFTDGNYLQPDAIGEGYTLINLNLTWSKVAGEDIDLSAFISNVTNKVYKVGANSITQNASSGYGGVMYGAPRMFGVSARFSWGN